MKLDLFKLNNYNKLILDDDFNVPEELYSKTDIRAIKDLHISGIVEIKYDEVMVDVVVKGTFILPCAITLEDVEYSFESEIDEPLGNFNDFYEKNKNTLDILPYIWENIVSEVPIRVVKEGASLDNLNGEGWEIVSSD